MNGALRHQHGLWTHEHHNHGSHRHAQLPFRSHQRTDHRHDHEHDHTHGRAESLLIVRSRANAISSYSLPEKRRDYLPRLRSYASRRDDGTIHLIREEYSDGSRGDFTVGTDGAFNFTVPLREGPGIYTVVVWVTKKGDRSPIAASNISIRVDRPAHSFAGTR